MRRVHLALLGLSVFGFGLLRTSGACAEEEAHLAELRASAGVGAGNVGLTGRVGLSADAWLTRSLGLGLHSAWLGQAAFLESRSALLVGPQLLFKSYASPSGAWLFAASSGYARTSSSLPIPCETGEPAAGVPDTGGEVVVPPPSCFLSDRRSGRGNAGYASLEVGHQHEGQRFVLGVSLRGDVVGWPGAEEHITQFAGTLNVTWGLKAW